MGAIYGLTLSLCRCGSHASIPPHLAEFVKIGVIEMNLPSQVEGAAVVLSTLGNQEN
jgi:hypothetical protein